MASLCPTAKRLPLVVRRPFVAHDNPAAAILFPSGFPLHQHLNTAGQKRNLGVLAGHNVTQLLDSASEMGNLFFKLFHSCGIGCDPLWVKRRRVFLACFWWDATVDKGR